MGLFPSKSGAVRRVPTLPQDCWASALDFLPYVDATVARRTFALWRKSIDAQLKKAQKKNPNILRIARLVSTLRIGDPEGKCQAAMALGAMLTEEEDPVATAADGLTIRDVGGLEALVDLLESGDYDAKVCAAAALRRLSDDNAVLSNAICIAGGIQPMVNLLSTHDGDGRGKFDAAWALANFSDGAKPLWSNKSPGVITAIINAGAIAPLVELLRADDAEDQDIAMLALCEMTSLHQYATCPEAASALLDAGVVSPLVDLLRTGSDYAQIHVVSLVRSLQRECRCDDRRRMIADAYLPALELLRTGSDEVKRRVAIMAHDLTLSAGDHFSNHPALAASGAFPSLVEMMRSDDPEAQELAADTLRFLAWRNPVNRMAIIDAGALLPLIDALRTSVATMSTASRDSLYSDALLTRPQSFASLLQKLARGSAANQTACFEAGGHAPLLEMLGVGHEFDVGGGIMSSAAGAIGALVRGNAAISAALVDPELVARLMALLRSDVFHCGALTLIEDLAFDNVANQAALVDAGAIATLVDILRRQRPYVLAEAATALGSFGRNHRAALVDTGAVELLTKLAQIPSPLLDYSGMQAEVRSYDGLSENDRISKAASSALSMISPYYDRPLVEEGAAAFRRDPNLVIDAEPFSAMFSDSQFNDLMSLAGVASSNSGGEPSPKKPKTTRKKAKKPKAKKGGSSFFSDVMNAVGPGDS